MENFEIKQDLSYLTNSQLEAFHKTVFSEFAYEMDTVVGNQEQEEEVYKRYHDAFNKIDKEYELRELKNPMADE